LLLVDWVKDAFLFQSDAVLTSLLVVAFGKQASYLSPPAMGCLKCQHRTIASHLARVDTAQGREATGKRGHTACNRDPLIAQLVSFLVVRVGHAAGHGEATLGRSVIESCCLVVNILDGLRFWTRNTDACGAPGALARACRLAGNGLVSHEYGNGRVPLLRQEVGHTFSVLQLGFLQ
jgi:hypothetical protein